MMMVAMVVKPLVLSNSCIKPTSPMRPVQSITPEVTTTVFNAATSPSAGTVTLTNPASYLTSTTFTTSINTLLSQEKKL
jgi:hypothetical protein